MQKGQISHFIIRVYGIITNKKNEVLVSDEYVFDTYMTKFPGGGMNFGEGPEDCILREAYEEFGQKVEILSHFYTTGFFQKAWFYDNHQLISIYYKLKFITEPAFRISQKPFDFKNKINGSQSFRWLPITMQNQDIMTFPIDRYVFRLLNKEKHGK